MLTVCLLVLSGLLALIHKHLGRWSGLLSFSLITKTFSFEWLPGVVFAWAPSHPSLVFVVALIISTSLVYARRLSKEQTAMVLFFSAGLVGFLGAVHTWEVFFFLEFMLFPVFYILLKEDRSAAFKYFGFMQASSMLVLAGLVGEGIVASGLLTLGFSIKMGLFPFHSWLPEAHAQAPFQVSALLSGALVACGAYGILMYSTTPLLALPLGVISAIYGALKATTEKSFKRTLAYSTISQMGYASIALAVAPEALVLFLVMHALAKSSLFFTAGEIGEDLESLRVSSVSLTLAVSIASLSLLGFPPLLGFNTDFRILLGAAGFSPLLAILMAFAFLPTFFYCERLISPFLEEGKKVESALPLILALLLLPGVINWML